MLKIFFYLVNLFIFQHAGEGILSKSYLLPSFIVILIRCCIITEIVHTFAL